MFITNYKLILINLLIYSISSFSQFEDVMFIERNDLPEHLDKVLRRIAEEHEERDVEIVFSRESSIQFSGFDLSLSLTEEDSIDYPEGVEIKYTLDGSVPLNSSSLYESPIEVSNVTQTSSSKYAVVVRAAGFMDGERISCVFSQSYVFYEDSDKKYKLPIISLITDETNLYDPDSGIYVKGVTYTGSSWSGNYFQTGIDWERDIHLSYFDELGAKQLQQDAGVRIHGGLQRSANQKSLRFYARKEYGDKDFDYQLMPQKEKDTYKRFILRTSAGDWNNTFIKDALAVDLVRGLGIEMQDYRPVITLLNGENFGIYWIRDYLGTKHLSDKYNIGEDSISIIVNSSGNQASEGTNENYVVIKDFVKSHDLSESSNYEHVKGLMDIYDYINYYASEIYLNNYDWPGGNLRAWESSEYDGRFRWIFYDLDAAFNGRGGFNHNMLNQASTDGSKWPNGPESSLIFAALLNNQEFRDEFITRSAYIAHYNFSSDRVLSTIEKIKAMVEPEIDFQIKRWSNPSSLSSMNSAINSSLISFATARGPYVQGHYKSKFGLSGISSLSLNTNEEHGSITLNDLQIPQDNNTADYYNDAVIRLKAIPKKGYKFDHWMGGLSDSLNQEIEIILSADLVLEAIFIEDSSQIYLTLNEVINCDREEKDWLEILLNGDDTPDFSKWFLSDEEDELEKWSFSELENPVFNEHKLMVLLDNKETDEVISDTTTIVNFKFGTDETIYLSQRTDDSLIIVDDIYISSSSCLISSGTFENKKNQILAPTKGEPNSLKEVDMISYESLVINELLASNSNVLQDDEGEFDDWLELYNGSTDEININGLFLSDDRDVLFKNEISLDNSILLPNQHILFWADDDDGQDHLNFKLKKDGECVFLSSIDPEIGIIDSVCYSSQITDVSYGRKKDGLVEFIFFDVPTPRKTNEEGVILSNSTIEKISSNIYFYPNPVSSELNIHTEESIELVEIIDLMGKTVSSLSTENLKINVSDLTNGVYILQIQTDKGKVLSKFIKK